MNTEKHFCQVSGIEFNEKPKLRCYVWFVTTKDQPGVFPSQYTRPDGPKPLPPTGFTDKCGMWVRMEEC